jgi:hypothetical protein
MVKTLSKKVVTLLLLYGKIDSKVLKKLMLTDGIENLLPPQKKTRNEIFGFLYFKPRQN